MAFDVHLRFVVAALATWRVTHLLAHEDGPADLIVRLRIWLDDSFAGKLMDCFLCLSIWIGALAAIAVTREPVDWVLAWLGLSGAACLLERLGSKPVLMEMANPNTEGELDDVLWTETRGAAK